MSDDLWDRWEDLEAQFARMARWAPFQQPGGWADADMLPLGRIALRAERGTDRLSRLTPAEQQTMMTLWCISRLPLMVGCDLPTSPPETVQLLTNEVALDVHRSSTGNRELLREKGLVLWAADSSTAAGTRFAALFNTAPEDQTVHLRLAEVGCEPTGPGIGWVCEEGWSRTTTTVAGSDTLDVVLPAHGAALFRCSPVDR